MEAQERIAALMPKFCSYRKLAKAISRHNKICPMMICKIYHHKVNKISHDNHMAIEKVFREYFG